MRTHAQKASAAVIVIAIGSLVAGYAFVGNDFRSGVALGLWITLGLAVLTWLGFTLIPPLRTLLAVANTANAGVNQPWVYPPGAAPPSPRKPPSQVAHEFGQLLGRGKRTLASVTRTPGYRAGGAYDVADKPLADREESVRRWATTVHAHLVMDAPGHLAAFDKGQNLPVLTGDQKDAGCSERQLRRFMKRKIANLERIIEEVKRGRIN